MSCRPVRCGAVHFYFYFEVECEADDHDSRRGAGEGELGGGEGGDSGVDFVRGFRCFRFFAAGCCAAVVFFFFLFSVPLFFTMSYILYMVYISYHMYDEMIPKVLLASVCWTECTH